MSSESILLISLLTLLPICLGIEVLNLGIIKPILLRLDDRQSLAIVNIFLDRSIALSWWLLPLVSLNAIILNIVPNLRVETYLLKIGVVSLLLYILLNIYGSISIGSSITANVNIQSLFDRWELTVFMGVRLILSLVCYWSFLHYAMNPKA